MAFGEHKAAIVQRTVEGEISPEVPATFLQDHENCLFVLDEAAAAELTRQRTPWVVGPLEEMGLAWNDAMMRRAVTWLACETGKAVLKLTDEDYNSHSLQDLLAEGGNAYESTSASSANCRTRSPAGPAASRGARAAAPAARAFRGGLPETIVVFFAASRRRRAGPSAARSRGWRSRVTPCISSTRFPAAPGARRGGRADIDVLEHMRMNPPATRSGPRSRSDPSGR